MANRVRYGGSPLLSHRRRLAETHLEISPAKLKISASFASSCLSTEVGWIWSDGWIYLLDSDFRRLFNWRGDSSRLLWRSSVLRILSAVLTSSRRWGWVRTALPFFEPVT